MYIVYYNNEIRYITNNFHDSLIVMLHLIKDYATIKHNILEINTFITEYYGESYVLFANKYIFCNNTMTILDMHNNRAYITNKFDSIIFSFFLNYKYKAKYFTLNYLLQRSNYLFGLGVF